MQEGASCTLGGEYSELKAPSHWARGERRGLAVDEQGSTPSPPSPRGFDPCGCDAFPRSRASSATQIRSARARAPPRWCRRAWPFPARGAAGARASSRHRRPRCVFCAWWARRCAGHSACRRDPTRTGQIARERAAAHHVAVHSSPTFRGVRGADVPRLVPRQIVRLVIRRVLLGQPIAACDDRVRRRGLVEAPRGPTLEIRETLPATSACPRSSSALTSDSCWCCLRSNAR